MFYFSVNHLQRGWSCIVRCKQGAATPIYTVLAAATGIKMQSMGQDCLTATVTKSKALSGADQTIKRQYYCAYSYTLQAFRTVPETSHFDPGRGHKYSVYWSHRPLCKGGLHSFFFALCCDDQCKRTVELFSYSLRCIAV